MEQIVVWGFQHIIIASNLSRAFSFSFILPLHSPQLILSLLFLPLVLLLSWQAHPYPYISCSSCLGISSSNLITNSRLAASLFFLHWLSQLSTQTQLSTVVTRPVSSWIYHFYLSLCIFPFHPLLINFWQAVHPTHQLPHCTWLAELISPHFWHYGVRCQGLTTTGSLYRDNGRKDLCLSHWLQREMVVIHWNTCNFQISVLGKMTVTQQKTWTATRIVTRKCEDSE